MIYVFKIKGTTHYKVGYTSRSPINIRHSQIQSDCPYIIEIYATGDYPVSAEYEFHFFLSDYRMRGEWFDLPNAIAKKLKAAMRLDEITHDNMGRIFKPEAYRPFLEGVTLCESF